MARTVVVFGAVGTAAGLTSAWVPDDTREFLTIADYSLIPGIVFGVLIGWVLLMLPSGGPRLGIGFAYLSISAWFVALWMGIALVEDHDWAISEAGFTAGAIGAGILGAAVACLSPAFHWRWAVPIVVATGAVSGSLLEWIDNEYAFFAIWQGSVAAAITRGLAAAEEPQRRTD